MLYPEGLMVEYDEAIYRVSASRTLLPFLSWQAAISWNQPIFPADVDTIEDNYTVSKSKLGYRPSTVVQDKDGETFYIEGTSKRPVPKYVYRLMGFNDFETLTISDEDLAFHPTGDPVGE